MKKRNFLAISLLAMAICANAQTEDYDLSSYKTASYNRKALDFKFNASGSLQNKTNSGTDNNLGGTFSGEFSTHKNTRKLQRTQLFGLITEGSHKYLDDKSFSNTTSRANDFGLNAYYVRESRHYLTSTFFLELSPYGSVNYNRSFNKEDDTKYNSSRFSTRLGGRVGVGVGRIENVEDARQAIYILDKLKDKKLLNKTLSNDEVNELAAVITRIKNKRQLDSRIKLIEEITCVDSMLVAKGYVDEGSGAAYYTTLYDMWMYGGLPIRQSGKRFSIGINPDYQFYRYNRHSDNLEWDPLKQIESTIEGSLYAKYEYEKPVKLKYQQSAYLSANAAWGKPRNAHNLLATRFEAYYGWGYYMNTRTYINLSATQKFSWTRYAGDSNFIQTTTKLNLEGYYYLSPQFRVFGECALSYDFYRNVNYNQNIHDKHPQLGFNFGIQYSLF